MVFHPTIEEFRDFSRYMQKIEEMGAHIASGICKIVPPPEWTPRPIRGKSYTDVLDYVIESPVKEKMEGMGGKFTKINKVYRKTMTVAEFEKLATSHEYCNPKPHIDLVELERHYWRSLLIHEPIYGADTPGSLYDPCVEEFNMNNLGTVLDLLKEKNIKIHGVNTVYLYFGMWKTTFPWHAEDMDLYSINYLHYGEPKFWYGIPTEVADRFERLASHQFTEAQMNCKAFLRHKTYMLSPSLLQRHGIPFGTMVQYPGEFMITFPRGYHAGFNTGYNCAESTNFALERWIDFGKNSLVCMCRPDRVEIDMTPFMQKYRPDEFNSWYDYWYGERASPVKKTGRKGKKGSEISYPPSVELQHVLSWKRNLEKAKKEVRDLWAHSPLNLFAEKQFNEARSKAYPHCSVCQYFVANSHENEHQKVDRLEIKIPTSSRRYVTQQMFAKDQLLDKSSEEPEEDRLLSCSNCYVTVHEHCYSALPSTSSQDDPYENWLCARCQNRDDTLIRSTTCHLCEMRGGALIEARNGGDACFVHVICALMHRRTKFVSPDRRSEPFTYPTVKLGHALPDTYLEYSKGSGNHNSRFQCEVCGFQKEGLLKCELCDDEANTCYFHATCAWLADVMLERRDWPSVAVAVCSIHNIGTTSSQEIPQFAVGNKVYVLLDEESRIEKGTIRSVSENLFCTVDFLDGSTSNDVYPCDIKRCECSFMNCNGQHIPGSLVYVEWVDKQIYQAYYRGRGPSVKFLVSIRQNFRGEQEEVEVDNDAIFLRSGPLPQHVRKLVLKRKSTPL
uniref:[Histone H3]-trimethyl-L-lysine(9) demethylase n=1 Tax=Acrobeloides nanus TaxID=290746 RepID=A0A914DJY0_9BILA